jgi:hypothetical protein
MLKRALIGSVAAVTLATGGTLAYSATAQATTQHQPSARTQLHRLERAIVTGATVGIDGVTYRAEPVTSTGQRPDRGHARTCRAFARWNAAGVPSYRLLQRLARDADRLHGPTIADNALQIDTAYLVMDVTGQVNGSAAAAAVAHDCGQD